MPIEYIGTGTYPNDTTGDPLQLAFTKCNDNFNLLYNLSQTNTAQFYLNTVSVTLAGGAQDYGTNPPPGYIATYSNQLMFMANAAGSTLNGLLAAVGGFTVLIFNPATTGGILFGHHAAGSSANQFTCPGGVSAYLGPLSGTLLCYITGQGWVFL